MPYHAVCIMKILGCTFILSLLAFSSCFAQTSPPQTETSSKNATVAGQVLNAVTGGGVAKAQLTLRNAGKQSDVPVRIFSDASGHFVFSNVEPGKYQLRAERSQFMSAEYGAPGSDQPGTAFSVAAAQTFNDIKIKLMPQGVISGRIFGADGDPLTGASVTAMRAPSIAGSSASLATRVMTNDLGEYRLYGLPPGRYYVSASYRLRMVAELPSAPQSVSSGPEKGGLSKYYPSVQRMDDATPLDVAPGGVLTSIDITLPIMGLTPAPSPQAGGESSKTTVQGQVVNAATGYPVPNAHVELRGGEEDDVLLSTIADASGNFTLRNILPGSYRLGASHNGFMYSESGARDAGQPGSTFSLAADQTREGVLVKLVPLGVITGRILEEDVPLPNAVVMALHWTFFNGKRQLVMATRAYANDLGEYRLYGLPPGRYYLSANYRGGMLGSGILLSQSQASASENEQDGNYVATYYPDALSVAEATPLELAPGNVLSGIDLALSKMRKVRLAGRVISPTGHLDGDVTVALMPREAAVAVKFNGLNAAVHADTGEFEIPSVPPGAYVLAVDWSDGTQWYSARKPVDVGRKPVENLVVPLIPALRIAGRLQAEDDSNLDLPDLQVSLEPRGEGVIGGDASVSVKKDGSFNIDNVRPGRYQLSVSGLTDARYVKAAYLGEKDITRSDVDLTRGAAGEIKIVVSAAGGKVDGVVLDDQQEPVKTAMVALVPEPRFRDQNQLFKFVTTDQNGKFSLRGIAPGQYKAFASKEIDPDSYRDPETVASFDGLGQALTVQENGAQSIQLTLIPAPQIR